MTTQAKALYISHGGGPLPLLGDPGHQDMAFTLTSIAQSIEKPSAIVVVSAHWEETQPTITASPNPALLYDYYGFPPEAYQIQYPCPGHPNLANQVMGLLDQSGITCKGDDKRGFDHGLFVPLTIMYPQADIPCVQLSLVNSLDPKTHIAIGRALRPLAEQNVLVLGSGFSFHNMSAFFAPETPATAQQNQDFEDWLITTCTAPMSSQAEREQRLIHWQGAPAARYCHPREEHLLPLHVCLGVGGGAADKYYQTTILNKQSSMYLWC